MRFDFIRASEKRREVIEKAIKKEIFEYDKDIILQSIILGAISNDTSRAWNFREKEGYNPKELDVKLMINGIEVDLDKGLVRLEQLLNNK